MTDLIDPNLGAAYYINLAINEFRGLNQFLHQLKGDSHSQSFETLERGIKILQTVLRSERDLKALVEAADSIAESLHHIDIAVSSHPLLTQFVEPASDESESDESDPEDDRDSGETEL